MDFDFRHIDELFREKFEDFEVTPPPSVWEKIKTSLSGGSSGTLFSNPINLASVAAIILIALMVGLNIIKQPDSNMVFMLENPLKETASDHVTAPATGDQGQFTEGNIQKAAESQVSHDVLVQTSIAGPSALAGNSVSHGPQTSFGKQFKEPGQGQKRPQYQPYPASSIGFNGYISKPSENSLNIIGRESQSFRPSFADGDYVRKAKNQWILGLYFTPEVLFYPQDNIQNQSAYHVDVSAALNFDGYFIESGLGLNFSKDDGAYKYDYEKYLGTYDDVYLVTFDSTENGVIPTYYTQPVDVYDSIREVFKPTKNKYTYLEIPLLFGVRKQVNRLTWFVKAGPAIDLLIHEKKGDQGQVDKDRFTIIENEQPKRLNAYWQVMFSAGINYRVGKHFSLAFEPVFRYHIQSGYEKAYIRSKHPYAIGVRAGLLYNF